MKRFLNTLMLALCAAAVFTACDDYNSDFADDSANQLKIVSCETTFEAGPSQGSVVVEGEGEVTVTSSDKTGWVTTAVDGNTISVAVDMNPSLEGRSATLSIVSGKKKAEVAIIQSGLIFSVENPDGNNLVFDDKARALAYKVKSNIEPLVGSNVDWINAILEEGELKVNVTENTDGHLRKGKVLYKVGETLHEILTVTQCEFDKDIAGEYEFTFTDIEDGKLKYFPSELTHTGDDYAIEIPALKFSIPVTFDEATNKIGLASGKFIGKYSSYFAYTVFWDTEQGYITWSEDVSVDAAVQFGYLQGKPVTLAQFEDNGSWQGYNIDCLRLEAFKAEPIASGNRAGFLAAMGNPYLLRMHEATESSASVLMSEGKANVKSFTQTAAELFLVKDNAKAVSATTARIIK